MRQSEVVRRDEALRSTRQRLRQTDHWSLNDERQRRAFQQLCDHVRRQRLRKSHSDASFPRCSADQTRTERRDERLGSSSGSLAATSATPTSTDVATPLRVTLHVTATSNSTPDAVRTTAALCVTTDGCSTTCDVQVTSVAHQSYATVSSSSAGCCATRSVSKLPSLAHRGRVTFDELPTEIPTTNGVIDSNDDDDDDRSSVVRGSTPGARVTTGNVDDIRSLLHTSNSSELPLASGELTPPPLKSFGDSNKVVENARVGRVDSTSRSAPTDGGVAGVKENVPPSRTVVNGGAPSTRLGRPASATTHQRLTTANQRAGWPPSGGVVAVTCSATVSYTNLTLPTILRV